MTVADDGDGNLGRVVEKGFGLFDVEMANDDDEVGPVFHFGGDVVDGFDDGLHLKGANLLGRGIVAGEVAHDQADDGYAKTAYVFNDVSFAGEEGAVAVFNVGGKQGEVRDAGEVLNRLPAVIEFMIADGSGIEAEQVRQFVEGRAVVEGGDRRALDKIAGVEKKQEVQPARWWRTSAARYAKPPRPSAVGSSWACRSLVWRIVSERMSSWAQTICAQATEDSQKAARR